MEKNNDQPKKWKVKFWPYKNPTKKVEGVKCQNPDCSCKAGFFHSRCCNAHFEGKIKEDGTHYIVCEKCGKFVSNLSV